MWHTACWGPSLPCKVLKQVYKSYCVHWELGICLKLSTCLESFLNGSLTIVPKSNFEISFNLLIMTSWHEFVEEAGLGKTKNFPSPQLLCQRLSRVPSAHPSPCSALQPCPCSQQLHAPPGCSASPTLCKASSPVQVESPSCASPAMPHLGQPLQAIKEEEKVLAVFSWQMQREARRKSEEDRRFVSKPMVQPTPLLGNSWHHVHLCHLSQKLSRAFYFGIFFLGNPFFLTTKLEVKLQIIATGLKGKTKSKKPKLLLNSVCAHVYVRHLLKASRAVSM